MRKKAKYLHDAPVGDAPLGHAPSHLRFPQHSPPHVTVGGIAYYPPAAAAASSASSASASPSYPPHTFTAPNVGSSSVAPPLAPVTQFSAPSADPQIPLSSSAQLPISSAALSSSAQMSLSTTSLPSTITGLHPYDPSLLNHSDPTLLDPNNPALFDPNDPSLFPFDLADFEFGNHYGALEFGMLGHMSSGAVQPPHIDSIDIPPPSTMTTDGISDSVGYVPGWNYQSQQAWPALSSSQNPAVMPGWDMQTHGMDAFAVGEPLSHPDPNSLSVDLDPISPDALSHHTASAPKPPSDTPHTNSPQPLTTTSTHPVTSTRRRRDDPATIYDAVTEPYPYTQAFHAVTAFLQRRFPPAKVMRIASALAAVRPSFIACNRHLGPADLVQTEKSLRRALLEYDSHLAHTATPTIICRRTGEVVAASHEFALLTGWPREILLGHAPNLNINTGRGSAVTPPANSPFSPDGSDNDDTSPCHPVFLAELLDEDSVVRFYEDFARLAFGAAQPAVTGESCALLRYRTVDADGGNRSGNGSSETTGESTRTRHTKKVHSGVEMGAASSYSSPPTFTPEGSHAGADADRVPCGMCWQVKRDMFDMPMLLVLSVSHLLSFSLPALAHDALPKPPALAV